MALFECKKKSSSESVNYMYFTSLASGTFTDTCEVGDIYVLVEGYNDTPTINSGLELIEEWTCGTQTYYKTHVYRATSTSVSISYGRPFTIARFSKNGKQVSYDLLNLTANVELSISCEYGDILCFPFVYGSVTYTLGANIMIMAENAPTSNRISIFRATGTTVGFKNNNAYKVLRFY